MQSNAACVTMWQQVCGDGHSSLVFKTALLSSRPHLTKPTFMAEIALRITVSCTHSLPLLSLIPASSILCLCIPFWIPSCYCNAHIDFVAFDQQLQTQVTQKATITITFVVNATTNVIVFISFFVCYLLWCATRQRQRSCRSAVCKKKYFDNRVCICMSFFDGKMCLILGDFVRHKIYYFTCLDGFQILNRVEFHIRM